MRAGGFVDVFLGGTHVFVNITAPSLGITLWDLGNTSFTRWYSGKVSTVPTHPQPLLWGSTLPTLPAEGAGPDGPVKHSVSHLLCPPMTDTGPGSGATLTIDVVVRKLQSALKDGPDQPDSLLRP